MYFVWSTTLAYICRVFAIKLIICQKLEDSSLRPLNARPCLPHKSTALKIPRKVFTPSCRHYDLIFKKIFLLAEYAKTDKVNVFWVSKFNWQFWGDFTFLYRIRLLVVF